MKTLSVFGLGKLGCTMLACFAHRGWQVIGIDVLEASVDKVNRGESPIYEPGVDELLKANKDRIRATKSVEDAVLNSEASFVIVPTPSKDDGSFSIDYMSNAIRGIASALAKKQDYHLIIVTSTVMPGDTEYLKDLIEDISGKVCGQDFGVCYNPDFIALGKVVHDFLNPDMILIGESDPKAGELLAGIHEELTNNNPEIHRMSFHNAELAKIAINCYLTLKINYANVIGEICENMPTGDAQKVLNAVGADSRIGKKYLKAGLPSCGPCLPRDNRAFRYAANAFKVNMSYAELSDLISKYHKHTRIPKILNAILTEKNTDVISILGVTYKEDVSIVEESTAIEVIKQLAKVGYVIRIYDPAGMEAAKKELQDYEENLIYCDSIDVCLKGSGVCFIATPWAQFKKLTLERILSLMGPEPVILDAWRLFGGTDIESNLDYRVIGKLNMATKTLIPILE